MVEHEFAWETKGIRLRAVVAQEKKPSSFKWLDSNWRILSIKQQEQIRMRNCDSSRRMKEIKQWIPWNRHLNLSSLNSICIHEFLICLNSAIKLGERIVALKYIYFSVWKSEAKVELWHVAADEQSLKSLYTFSLQFDATTYSPKCILIPKKRYWTSNVDQIIVKFAERIHRLNEFKLTIYG